MEGKKRIGVICDMHLPANRKSAQYAFLQCAARQMHEDAVDAVICAGDVTGYGELEGYQAYRELLSGFHLYEVEGNSDVRNVSAEKEMVQLFQDDEFVLGRRRVIGIHTPYAYISVRDKERLRRVQDGDIIFLHHDILSLESSGDMSRGK